jgi:hypothetical protein
MDESENRKEKRIGGDKTGVMNVFVVNETVDEGKRRKNEAKQADLILRSQY